MMQNNRMVQSIRKFFGNTSDLFDSEIKLSAGIPIKYFATPSIFVTAKGELGTVLRLNGIPFSVKSAEESLSLQQRLAFLLQHLSDQFAIYFHTHRHKQSVSLMGDYPLGFANDFMTAYEQQFAAAHLFVNELYITILQKTDLSLSNVSFIDRFNDKKQRVLSNETRQLKVKQFATQVEQCLATLQVYQPTLLADKIKEDGSVQSEVLSFLSILVNAKKRAYVYPYQDIASFVPDNRLFIGKDTLHFKGSELADQRYAAILSIKHYCPTTNPGMLNAFLTFPFEYVMTSSFHGIAKQNALALIDKKYRRLIAAGDAAISQIAALEQAMDEVASGNIGYGFNHHTLMIIGSTPDALEAKVSLAVKAYQDQGLVVVRESLNLKNAYFAQIPGNFNYIRRKAPISTNNISSFCSLHNYYSGYYDRNHLGGALLLAETPSKTPFYFNLHEAASGRKEDMSKGHTLLVAPSNAGKTVIMTVVDTAFKKYGIRSFFFDRNQGCETYVRAVSGQYYRLSPGVATGFNPCQLTDTPSNRHFLRDFFAVLATSKTSSLTPNDYRLIADVVERNYSLVFDKRNLSNIASFFPLDFTGLHAFSRYINLPDRTGKGGDLAYLFDNQDDTLRLTVDTAGFDLTHWLTDASEPPLELLPLSMYLFHRLEETFTGRLTGIYLDEGWQFLKQDYWKEKIQEYLVTLRKRNVFLFLSTQLPDQLAESSIASALMQSSATQLFLANPRAEASDYIAAFKLSQKEYQIIRELEPSDRYFLIKQGHESAIGRIPLQKLTKYLPVFSSNAATIERCDELRKKWGDDAHHWLPVFYQGNQ